MKSNEGVCVLTGSCADFNLVNAVKLFLLYSAEIHTREREEFWLSVKYTFTN